MFLFNIANPITLILMLAITLILIFLAKETKRAYLTAIALFFYLGLLIMHVLQVMTLPVDMLELKPTLSSCLAVDFTMILLTFLSYLWVDDIQTKVGRKKSIDNSLDWFWGKI